MYEGWQVCRNEKEIITSYYKILLTLLTKKATQLSGFFIFNMS